MDRQQIRTELEAILAIVDEKLTQGINVTEATLIREGLGLDSLQMTEMLFEIEDKMGVKIADDEAMRLKTIGNLMDLIQSKRGQGAETKGAAEKA